MPTHLRASDRSAATWRVKLSRAIRQALHERRAAPGTHASQLRAQLEEERGEGTAASAFCTSASHDLRPSATSKRMLIVFSGPYSRPDSLAAFLHHVHGYEVTMVDNDPEHGSADDNFLDEQYFDQLLRRVQEGYYCAIFAAPPCSTFSVSRHYKAKLKDRRDKGPPPVRLRHCPAGRSPPPPGHASELATANAIIDKLCILLAAATEAGCDWAVENPSDRGDPASPHTFLFADHAPLWLHPRMLELQRHSQYETTPVHPEPLPFTYGYIFIYICR